VLSVVSSDQQEHSRLEFTLDVPVGELLQTYLSPNGRQLAVVLDVDADIAAWQGLARALVDADPLITRASSEGLRGGPGIVFQLAKPVRLVEERIAIVDAQTARWFVELAVMPQSTVETADRPAAQSSASRDNALAGIEARQRGGVTELTLLGRRNLVADRAMIRPCFRINGRKPTPCRLVLRCACRSTVVGAPHH